MITALDTLRSIDLTIDFADFDAKEKIKMIQAELKKYWQEHPLDDGQEGKGLDGDYNTISGMPPSTEYIGAMSYTTKWVRELSFEQQTDLARMLDEFHAEQLAALPVADGEGK